MPSTTGGVGQTIGIVDGSDDPTAASDLAAYRAQYNLPPCTTANGCFKKVDEMGGTHYPPANNDWAFEISLDLDMVSAICPNCNIVLVEANLNTNLGISDSDAGIAENEAVAEGANAISNSFGHPEDTADLQYDSDFTHVGVAITAASGDLGYDNVGQAGAAPSWPATSTNVTSVGGTTLVPATNNRGWSESVWCVKSTACSTSGCSTLEAKPTWQRDWGCAGNKMTSDVSAVAFGVSIYDTQPPISDGSVGWNSAQGTSVSSPIIASAFGLAASPAVYSAGASDFYSASRDARSNRIFDVSNGSNADGATCTHSYYCNALIGYDGPTGVGTPDGPPSSPLTPSLNGRVVPLTPYRIADTRPGSGEPYAGQTLPPGGTLNIQVAGTGSGTDSIPNDGTAIAALLHVTDASATQGSFFTLYPSCAGQAPTSSVVSFNTGAVTSNLTEVPIGCNGEVTLYNNLGNADAVVDVQGYVSNSSGAAGLVNALNPYRIADTRLGSGEPYAGDTIGPGGTLNIQVSGTGGSGGVPSSGAEAAIINITDANATQGTFLTVYPTGTTRPTASNVNVFPAADPIAQRVVVPLGNNGKVTVYNQLGNTDIVIDVNGYLSDGVTKTTGSRYNGLTTTRMCDTRSGSNTECEGQTLGAGATLKVQVAGVGGIPISGVSAIAINVTIANQTTGSYMTVWPDGSTRPPSSDVNFSGTAVTANFDAVVQIGSDGMIDIYNAAGSADAIIDLQAYYQ